MNVKKHDPQHAARSAPRIAWRVRAEQAEDMVRAIQSGTVDAIVRLGPSGQQVFTLEGAEHVYRIMVESMGEGALTLARDGTILYANRRFADMLGKDLDHIVGANMKELMAPGSSDAFEALMREAGTGAADDTIRLLQSEGKRVSAHMTLRGLGTEGCANVVAVITDLSEVLHAAAARDQLAQIVDDATDAIIGKDLNGTITSWNKAAEALYGYTATEMIGKNINTLAPPERENEARTLIDTMLRGRAVQHYDTVRMTKAGERIDVLVTLSPIKDDAGTIVGFSSIAHDITEHKKLERLRDNFVSTVSHELRTPLTSISASLALLAGGAAGNDKSRAKEFVDMACRNANRLGRLVNDILDIEKLQSGKLEFHPEVLTLEVHVGNAVDAIRPLASKQGIALVADLGAQPHQVTTDPDRLSQAITNILSNAIKFSSAGAEVLVRIDDRDDSARVSIIDHGCGIPEDFRKRVFERFAQADDSSTRSQPGTGLGLSIAREIIQRLGGKISFESQVGKGTTFHIDLPIHHPTKRGSPVLSQRGQATETLPH